MFEIIIPVGIVNIYLSVTFGLWKPGTNSRIRENKPVISLNSSTKYIIFTSNNIDYPMTKGINVCI